MSEQDDEFDSCRICKFAGPRHGYDQFPCRRHAPIAVHDPTRFCGVSAPAFRPAWPLMSGDDWCGDFELVKAAEVTVDQP